MNNKRKQVDQANLEDLSNNQQNKKGRTSASVEPLQSSPSNALSSSSSSSSSCSNVDELADCQAALRAMQTQNQQLQAQLQAQEQASTRLMDALRFEVDELKTELTFLR